MNIDRVWAVFFSATGTTRKVVTHLATAIAADLGVGCSSYDFTLPAARQGTPSFAPGDLIVLGTPVYAGRVPNVLVQYLATLQGNGAVAVPVVVFGNRDYDDALVELRDILEAAGCHTVAAAAFVGEHAFSDILGAGRPDKADMNIIAGFAREVSAKLSTLSRSAMPAPISVSGVPRPYRPHYRPADPEGRPLDFRSIRPLTSDACNDCKLCVEVCPMGSIDYDNVREYTGICIRCGACVKLCPQGARYYDDPAYLRHKQELEQGFARRAEPALFI